MLVPSALYAPFPIVNHDRYRSFEIAARHDIPWTVKIFEELIVLNSDRRSEVVRQIDFDHWLTVPSPSAL